MIRFAQILLPLAIMLPFPFVAHAGSSVELVFVGDVMLADGPGRTIERGGDPLAAVASWLESADYTIGNLECPVAASGTEMRGKPVTFLAHPRVVQVLKGRFDAMALSNNHSGDYGAEAVLETVTHLTSAGIKLFGGGANLKAAHEPLWIEKRGIKIAVLGYNEFKPRSFEAGPSWPGIAWSEDSHVLADIAKARRAGADLVIPFMHWGWENEEQPNERQNTFARQMIDHGADMVIGGHPHVTQGVAEYKGKPIVWSLGNFVFDGFDEGAGRWGWLLQVTASKRAITSYRIVPVHLTEDGTPFPKETSERRQVAWSRRASTATPSGLSACESARSRLVARGRACAGGADGSDVRALLRWRTETDPK